MAEDIRQLFRDGALEHLAELEQALLQLEEPPDDPGEVARVFRVMHTLKGSAAMVGLLDVSEFAHQLETEFDAVRIGQRLVTAALIDWALQARDQLFLLIDAHYGGEPASAARSEEILAGIRAGRDPNATGSRQQLLERARMLLADLKAAAARLTDTLVGHGGWMVAPPAAPAAGAETAAGGPGGLAGLPDAGEQGALVRLDAGVHMVRHLAARAGCDCLTEFLGALEAASELVVHRPREMPADLLPATLDAITEAGRMVDEELGGGGVDLSAGPEALFAALERPLAIRRRLDACRDALGVTKVQIAAGPRRAFHLSLRLPSDRFPAGCSGAWLVSRLRQLGEVAVIRQPGREVAGAGCHLCLCASNPVPAVPPAHEHEATAAAETVLTA